MTYPHFQWRILANDQPPTDWQQAFETWARQTDWHSPFLKVVGQLLWQRGWRQLADIQGFLDVASYQPTPATAFGEEMTWAIARLQQAHLHCEKVAIWGDFDADGLTATAVLWEGLGQFLPPPDQLRYYIPNRFTESHGLSQQGLDELAAWGCQLIVTCDTGSTAAAELAYAHSLGMDVIVTDHHTLPTTRPPIVALINPRSLPSGHPLADLSGVAVAYKLVEALYQALPSVPDQSLETLLDLVAIGLIADLVALRGDCRYLTQVGLQRLEAQAKSRVRPGVTKLLEFCKGTGDRPSDVAFGIGPRINAVSRIHGDASFGVELLTSRDRAQAQTLAFEAELANTRRKDLQATVLRQAKAQLATLDLSTTQVILLSDPQWSPGVLGLVASQIAQEYGRPTILFQTETTTADGKRPLARGSARSVHHIDFYELLRDQAHLLTSFGGHPFAAGMSLPVDNLPLLATGLNRAVRSLLPTADLTHAPPINVDCSVTIADLGKELFRALKRLEPYGMGNPIPRLLLRQVHIDNVREHRLQDRRGGKQRYFKLSFDITDPKSSAMFPGHWWGQRQQALPAGWYDLVIELDFNAYQKRYEARLVDLCPAAEQPPTTTAVTTHWLIDQREATTATVCPPAIRACPVDWSEFSPHRATTDALTLAYPPPEPIAPEQQWQQLLGIAKYLSRTGEPRSLAVLQRKLQLSDRTLQAGLAALRHLGFEVSHQGTDIHIAASPLAFPMDQYQQIAQTFLNAVQEENFRRQYFYEVPVHVLEQVLGVTTFSPPTSDQPQSPDGS